MAKDKPGFLQNIGDDEEERETLSVLQDEKPIEEKPVENVSGPSGPSGEDTSGPSGPSGADTTVSGPSGPSGEDISGPSGPSGTKEEKSLIMGKYKTQEEFEKAHNELQRAFAKIQNEAKKAGLNADPKAKDELAPFRKIAVIKSTIPDPAKYYFKNEKGEEVLDLNLYMKDTLNNFAIAVQQNLLGGPLAAAVFSMLGKAINDEQSSALETGKREENAVKVWENVQKAYPILAKDERLQGLYERAIYGEKHKRTIEAKKNGTEYIDMVEADYIKLAGDIIGTQPTVVTPQKEEPAEKPKGDVSLRETTPGITSSEKQVNKDIDDMMATKRKSLF